MQPTDLSVSGLRLSVKFAGHQSPARHGSLLIALHYKIACAESNP